MWKITIQVSGMMCGMCESHINDTIRRTFSVKKVTSSHTKGQTVLVTQEDIPDEALREAIMQTGYEPGAITREPYVKKGLFSFGH